MTLVSDPRHFTILRYRRMQEPSADRDALTTQVFNDLVNKEGAAAAAAVDVTKAAAGHTVDRGAGLRDAGAQGMGESAAKLPPPPGAVKAVTAGDRPRMGAGEATGGAAAAAAAPGAAGAPQGSLAASLGAGLTASASRCAHPHPACRNFRSCSSAFTPAARPHQPRLQRRRLHTCGAPTPATPSAAVPSHLRSAHTSHAFSGGAFTPAARSQSTAPAAKPPHLRRAHTLPLLQRRLHTTCTCVA
eukprot:356291-Chlamydomonas_euryale.AAC.1